MLSVQLYKAVSTYHTNAILRDILNFSVNICNLPEPDLGLPAESTFNVDVADTGVVAAEAFAASFNCCCLAFSSASWSPGMTPSGSVMVTCRSFSGVVTSNLWDFGLAGRSVLSLTRVGEVPLTSELRVAISI